MGNTQTPGHIRPTTDNTNTPNTSNEMEPEQKEEKIKIDFQTLLDLISQMEKIKMNEFAETLTSNKINMKNDFKIYVGIDFGTRGCGIAYGVNEDLLPKNEAKNDDDSSDSDDDSSDSDDNENDEKYANEGNIDGYRIITHQWNDIAWDNSKLNTCILLNDKNELQMVGNLARITFTEMQKKNWKLFDNFKMSLYKNDCVEEEIIDENKDDEKDDENKENDDNTVNKKKFITLKHKIKSYDGSITESDVVFCATLKYLKEAALKYIEERIQIKNIAVDDIQWILTIPALWNNESKHMMRQWGLASGLINKDITNHLKIVLEPECASLQIQHEFYNNKNIKFNKNDSYILVDGGGGTVDIVAHEIYSDFGVKEITPSCGGPFGSINIDKKFDELFDLLFEKENMDCFRQNRSKEYVKWLENVVAAKRSFYSNGESNMYHAVELDMTFYNKMNQKKFNNKKFKKYIKSIQQIFGVNATEIGIEINKKESMFKISTTGIDYAYLNIHKNLWKKIFDDNCLNDIIKTVKEIIKQNAVLNDIKYIFMVGGLSQSKYYQKRMKDEFKTISIVIPQNPLLSVVCGAARYGYKTDFIHTRILKKTYALRISASTNSLMMDHKLLDLVHYIENNDDDNKNNETEQIITKLIRTLKDDEGYDDFKDNMNDQELRKKLCDKMKSEITDKPISKEWIEKNSRYHPISKTFVCNGLLSILAKKGEQIIINSKDKITRTYKRWSEDQKYSTIEIYCSNNKNPQIIDEATKLCEGTLIYPEMNEDANDSLDVIFEVSFDDSLLIAFVYPAGKPNQRAEIALEYQTN